MSLNSKVRSDAIQAAARALLIARGVDVTQRVNYRPLAKELKEQMACDISTAKRHIGTAVRRARGELAAAREWGGAREGAGRPKAERGETSPPLCDCNQIDNVSQ